ncbi:MAG: DUF1295 domain-containing protein [Clostridia bacterium]|nr:DUF1295 domain-containing protein [Clostridia bacterium]
MKVENRALSFIIVALVYVVATAVGVAVYLALPFDFWLSLLLADIVATAVTFAFSLIFSNASVYDPYWSVQPLVICVAFALGKNLTLMHILPLVAVGLWGVRLTANWAYTFGGLTHQDWRYTMLSQKTGKAYPIINFVGIHLVPTLVVYGCVLPVVFLLESSGEINALSVAAFIVSLIAVTLQLVSDIQMQAYRKNRTTPFIRVGLWKYSRHPNYLGEILMWWGIALYALSVTPTMWWLIAGAVANTVLFLAVSIPMADGRQSKKEGFTQYKKQTRMLLPIFKKQD